eukprot:TRINITY_DN229_c0_g1_i1.p1 TRINITY_DN229_c0_g1~~TRINITY_DN229_c0_g1_i1.p1  ORF type:complete len:798 (-),score=167.63 TRINITY_DN229_c0_g1_i1:264-2657(-)
MTVYSSAALTLLLSSATLLLTLVTSDVPTATYDVSKLPKLKVVPPYRLVKLGTVEVQQDYTGWFCAMATFTVDNWDFTFAATQFSAWIQVDGATGITTVTSFFNQIKSITPATADNDVVFYPIIADYQSEYKNNQIMKFYVCGEKDGDTPASGFTFSGQMILSVDMRPPPYPYPSFPGWVLGSTTPDNDCFGYADANVIMWDLLLSSDLKNADHCVIGGKVAAGGNVFVNGMYSKLGSDYANCPNACTGLTNVSNSFVAAGGYVDFQSADPGICGGFIQGNDTLAPSNALVVDATCPAVTGSMPFDFNALFTNITSLSRILAKKQPTAAVGYALNSVVGGAMTFAFNNKFDDFIFYIPGDFISSRGVFKIGVLFASYLDNAKSVIFNIDGTSVALNFDMTQYFQDHADKVIFNFYQALTVQLGSGIYYGTMLAPQADFTIGGKAVVNGQVIAKTLTMNWGSLRVPSVGKYVGFTDYAGSCLSCAPGFYGNSCMSCNCSYNELCNDGVSGDGTCSCMPNFDAACYDCLPGFYGLYCNNTCTETCATRGTCDYGLNGTGACLSCKSPFNGTECETCIDTKWGPSCDNDCNSVCFEKGGTCDFGVNGTGLCASCGAPWGNGLENLCDDCDAGHYGSTCQFSCSVTCAKHGTCSHGLKGNGTCLSCRAIYTGTECQECASGFYGPDCLGNCTKSCVLYGVCNDGAKGDGSCSDCTNSTTGSQCELCETEGAYGQSCRFMCKDTCLANGKCDSGSLGTGRCLTCNRGWSGKYCQDSKSGSRVVFNVIGWFTIVVVVGLMMLL